MNTRQSSIALFLAMGVGLLVNLLVCVVATWLAAFILEFAFDLQLVILSILVTCVFQTWAINFLTPESEDPLKGLPKEEEPPSDDDSMGTS